MYKHKKILIVVILILQLLIISYLIYTIYAKYASATLSVAPITKNTINITPIDHLRYFFEPKPNITITEHYYQQVSLSQAPEYTINKDTLNERFNYSVKKAENTFRIITLGDSFTFGQYMNTADNWPEVLEDTLQTCPNKKFEVINLAVPSYDIQYSVERFKKRGMKYHPDLVIWFLKNDDFLQINEITSPIKAKYYEQMKKSGELKKSRRIGEYWPYTKKAMDEFEQKYTTEQILAKQLEIMREINKFYTGHMLVMSTKYTEQRMKSVIATFAKERKNTYTYYDLPVYAVLPDHHPSAQGHKGIAENIYTNLLSKKLLPCNL